MADESSYADIRTFGPEDWERLKQAQRVLHDLLPFFDKAEACGVECAGYRGLSTQLGDVMEVIEREFMSKAAMQQVVGESQGEV